MQNFKQTFNYKLIYIFSVQLPTHEGLLKIGDTSIDTSLPQDRLGPNTSVLNKAAHERIRSYTNTAGIAYKLLHTELAVRTVRNENGDVLSKGFRDFDVRDVLVRSGFKKVVISETTGKEWVKTDIKTAIEAIAAVKRGQKFLTEIELPEPESAIIFRPEQNDAITRTLKQFKTSDKMLWNAKMRFGKTVCALEIAKRMDFMRTIIVTHRPVVNDGWYEDFTKIFYNTTEFAYGSKAMDISIEDLEDSCKHYIYFASVQDLRGSDKVGGKFNKNDKVFDIDWDFVVVDEAHEGTTTALGDQVISELVKAQEGHQTKFLALSGTPFNIMGEYEDAEVYTWDYVMEQTAKANWAKNNFGDSNPYEELPKLNIFTYHLGKLLGDGYYDEIEDKAFNFKEFFRTWTGNTAVDFKQMPQGVNVGDFVHQQDVIQFLNLISKPDQNSNYPYATETFRELFQHSLWMVPGVKEARALSALMKQHAIFGNGLFDVVNVAGDGDEDEEAKDALALVRESIAAASKAGRYTITLSCGKLTTGVTVREWTAVMMLSGSYSTSAANYLQTVFRVQSPANINGKMKDNCYVFDFAPDRTLKMVADAVNLSAKAGKTSSESKAAMGQFLNFCPVISIDGTAMQKYNENNLLQQLKRAYAERAVKNGFDDTSIYNDIELSKLTESDLSKFAELKKIVGTNKASHKTDKVDINRTGLTNEEYEELEKSKKKPPKERTPEEQARLDELKEKRANRTKAISNLRAMSIRIPLLIYGADVEFSEDITAADLVNIVDDSSWEEFMPTGITKEMFQEFVKYYDADVFIAAGRKIRSIVKQADTLAPTERVQKITQLFSGFKNPDKETVLTPWRVVNMHMSDCLGGYTFFDEEHKATIEKPRFVDKGPATAETFANPNAKILEINSKTGLYPLYVTYSIFRSKCGDIKAMPLEEQNRLWNETVSENVFVICKTPMAKAITKRTLCGFNDVKVNSHYFEDLINMLTNKPMQFVDRVLKPSYWKLKGNERVKFDAIVGNPPYMEMDGGAQASAKPVYQHFIQHSKNLCPNYLSMIIPTRWYAGGKGLDEFRDTMLNDSCIRELHDFLNPNDLFPSTNIRGGVCYFLRDVQYDNTRNLVGVITHNNGNTHKSKRPLKVKGLNIFVRDVDALSILDKVTLVQSFEPFSRYISPRKPFGLEGAFYNDGRYHATQDGLKEPLVCYAKAQKIGYVEKRVIKSNMCWVDKWKVFIPYANNIGTELNDDNLNAFVGQPYSICTETYLVVGGELGLNERSARNVSDYLKTKFLRFLHSLAKVSQHGTSKTYCFVPVQDFAKSWTDEELYKKYNLTQEEIAFIEATIKPME